MKSFNSYLIFVLVQLLLCLILGCQDNYASVSFVKVETERTKLINGIESYQSIDELKSYLNRSSLKWEESKGQSSPKGRPPFDMYTITIKNYSHLGFTGELNIGFFNNRLMGTSFYPLDAVKYIAAVEKMEGIQFNSNKEAILPPHTRVKVAVEYKNHTYVDWSDSRLDKEMELWIKSIHNPLLLKHFYLHRQGVG